MIMVKVTVVYGDSTAAGGALAALKLENLSLKNTTESVPLPGASLSFLRIGSCPNPLLLVGALFAVGP